MVRQVVELFEARPSGSSRRRDVGLIPAVRRPTRQSGEGGPPCSTTSSNLADLMRNAGKIREDVEKATEALGQLVVEGSSGGGAVTAKANGRMELLSVRIAPEAPGRRRRRAARRPRHRRRQPGADQGPRGRRAVDGEPRRAACRSRASPACSARRPGRGGLTMASGRLEALDRLIEAFGRLPGHRGQDGRAARAPHPQVPPRGGPRPGRRPPRDQGTRPPLPGLLPPDRVDRGLCVVCRDPPRDAGLVCVVEQSRDLMALERAGTYRGVYHVLLGRLAPLQGVGPDQLTVDALVGPGPSRGRSARSSWRPTRSSKATAPPCSSPSRLAETGVPVTRLARGLASGSVLEFANKEMLADALSGRQRF